MSQPDIEGPIQDHVITPFDRLLDIKRFDIDEAGGPPPTYTVECEGEEFAAINFQTGPIGDDKDNINGVTENALIAILLHRFRCFQAGKFASRYNALVITKLEEALMWNQQRTIDRMRRGVEGKNEA